MLAVFRSGVLTSCSLSPTSAISYLCKHVTQIWWKSKLLNLFLRNFAECCFFSKVCGMFAEFCGLFAEFCRCFADVCGSLRDFAEMLRNVAELLRNFTEFAEVGNCRGRRPTV